MSAPGNVTNAEFLSAIFVRNSVFVSELSDVFPVVLPVTGPITPTTSWGAGWPWHRAGKPSTDAPDVNWFFTLSVYRPDATGKVRRVKASFAAAYGVFCDDVGVRGKAAGLERLAALPPSYLIETSPGSHHAGYLFDVPCTDLRRVEALQDALVSAGLCDPGSKGPASRLGRLPVAINNKAAHVANGKPAPRVRLVEWHPERRYSIEAIAEGLELDIAEPAAQAAPKRRAAPAKAKAADASARAAPDPDPAEEVDFVHRERPVENVVLAALRAAGLYVGAKGSGKHDITCPWAHEHSACDTSGTVYFEPGPLYELGGFKCMHGHCADRRIGHLLRHLGVPPADARNRAIIRVQPGELHRVVDAAELELSNAGGYYQRGGLIVQPVSDAATGQSSIRHVDDKGLTRALSSIARWERFDGRSGAWLRSDPPVRHVAVLAGASEFRHLAPLQGLAWQPYLRDDGSLCQTPGYDATSRLIGTFEAGVYRVPAEPSPAQARAALLMLGELLSEFGFAEEQDRSAALCAMLTAAVRPSLPAAPMIHVKAHQPGSGKSYLTSIIAAFAAPARPAFYPFPSDKEECAKLLLGALMQGPPCVVFDNLTGDLVPFESLALALIEESLAGRLLGFNKEARVSTRTVFLSSGNNVGPVKDMARRTLVINLDPRCESPATKRYAAAPLAALRENRRRYVSAALTVVRAYIVAGMPNAAELRPIVSYERWTRWARASLVWLGLPDPATGLFASIEEDPDRDLLHRLLSAWWKDFGDKATGVRDLLGRTSELFIGKPDADLEDAVREIAEERGSINRHRLGWWIKRHEGRIVNGLRLERGQAGSGSMRWRVRAVAAADAKPAPADAAPSRARPWIEAAERMEAQP